MDNRDEEALSSFSFLAEKARVKDAKSGEWKTQVINNDDGGSDSVMTIRVNSALKKHFEELCKADHSTVSRELKRYMSVAIRIQKLL